MTRRRPARPYSPAEYWQRRYLAGRSSGAGSEGDAAKAKAAKIDAVIRAHGITSVIDWGVGDGVVLGHVKARVPWLGLDIAPVAVERLSAKYARSRTKTFGLTRDGAHEVRDLALSLDVIFHLVEDADYDLHLAQVFGSATKAVLIHASDHDGGRTARHVRWRRFTADVAARFPDWRLAEAPEDPTVPGFHLYLRDEEGEQ